MPARASSEASSGREGGYTADRATVRPVESIPCAVSMAPLMAETTVPVPEPMPCAQPCMRALPEKVV